MLAVYEDKVMIWTDLTDGRTCYPLSPTHHPYVCVLNYEGLIKMCDLDTDQFNIS